MKINYKDSEDSSQVSMKNDLPLVPHEKNSATVALAGNPNVGKSLVFNYMSGLYVDVSNFPGTTVSITSSKFRDYKIFDTPGIYGISAFNDEEKVARKVIIDSEIVLNIVDAVHLERDLFLTLQLIDMGKKVSVILNMMDEVAKHKFRIDSKKLSELLGVEVFEMSAINGDGFENLENAISKARTGKRDEFILSKINDVLSITKSDSEALLLIEGDKETLKTYNRELDVDLREKIYISRRNRINEIIDQIEVEKTRKGYILSKIGHLSLNQYTGVPMLILILIATYFFIGDLVSQRLVKFTEHEIGKKQFEFWTKTFVSKYAETKFRVHKSEDGSLLKEFYFPEGTSKNPLLFSDYENYINQNDTETEFIFYQFLPKLLFGEFGIITMTITYLVFLLLPLVAAFYLTLALLEDSGYLPRLATLVDRTFNKMGLNGRAIIPIILGFGCVTMATLTTRLLGSEREKTIATAILQFTIPCSAQLAVIAVLLSGAGIKAILIYTFVILLVIIISSTLLNKLVPGISTPLLLDLPSMRLPKLNNLIKKTFYRTYGFMKEATPWFFIGAGVIGIMQISGILQVWQDVLKPLTVQLLQLPKEASTAFVMGLVRRDFGAAGLYKMNLSSDQIVVALITITLFVPCIASLMVMLKERGLKQGIIIWFSTWILAFTIGGIVSHIII